MIQKKLTNWLLIFACSTVFWLTAGCQQQANSEVDNVRILHTLDRLSFGTTSETIQQVKDRGIEAYIQAQLNPESIPRSPVLKRYLAKSKLIQTNPSILLERHKKNRQRIEKTQLSPTEKEKVNLEIRNYRQKIRHQAMEANLARAIAANSQLQEVMTNFWFNHFNVFLHKNDLDFWIADYENDIRKLALGSFRDLLGMTARHPAMLIYLDNQLNTDPNSRFAKGQFKGLNENYARELMELHTLGVDGGYSQKDVETLARILTGWGVDRTNTRGDENGFSFFPNRHDRSDKIFLGQEIPAGGIEEGEKALDILASHPATARFISYKLARYFVADTPPSSLVDALTRKFLDSGGNIKIVLNTLFHSQEFNDPQYYNQKFKTPYQYLVSLIRASGISEPNLQRLNGMLYQLAMPVYRCETPNGYPDTQDAWLNPDAMLRRVSFATAISNGALNKENPIDIDLLNAGFGNRFSNQTKEVIDRNKPRLQPALMLGSPEVMYR